MRIEDCNSCGQCNDFILDGMCPGDAMYLEGTKYKIAVIDQRACISCGLCTKEIDCLNESLKEG